jgi:oxysterol-binding protein-related protein 9/10/11
MTLIDLSPLRSVPKMVRPISKQHPTESRRLWESVTNGLLRKEFGEATRAKHVIEQRQRDEAAERKRRGVECVNFPSTSLSLSSGGRGGVNSPVSMC